VSVYSPFHHDRMRSIAHAEAGMLDLFCVLCKFLRSEVHGVEVVSYSNKSGSTSGRLTSQTCTIS
jgi:hypothetical protein